jgi:protein tyrosine phosphatase (PTP) superfamily phosphohydrolase (DUF442 family)
MSPSKTRSPSPLHARHARLRAASLPAGAALLAFACRAGDTGDPGAEPAPGARRGEVGLASGSSPSLDAEGLPVGLHHYRRWSARIAQGGQPDGEEAFRNLAALGFTTVVSVDGAIPEVELAARHGLDYAHVPIEYSGFEADEELRIVKVVSQARGPVYLHCHHGLHRGPAAAAIARIALDAVPPAQAARDLEASGCSPKYEGLYADVRSFAPPDAAALAAVGPVPSAVVPRGILEVMTAVDFHWDFVLASQKVAWANPPEHPDVATVHEAAILENLLRSLAELQESRDLGPEFLARAAAARDAAQGLEDALAAGSGAEPAFQLLKARCDACHEGYRN